MKYSKTRVVYWDNNLTNTSDENPNCTIITPSTNEPALYGVGEIEGSDLGWHHLPMNHYGLYLTTSEMQDLLELNAKITPVSAKVTIGHTIPLAQYPGTTNTLALSFNNTIYSKTYHQPPSARLCPMLDFDTIHDFYNFCRTFDGHRWVENPPTPAQRSVLPKPNLRFIYPKPDYWTEHAGSTSRANGYAREHTLVAGLNDSTAQQANIATYLLRATNYKAFQAFDDTVEQPLLENDLMAGYAPEFLQDNANLKALYPGENIDEFEVRPKPNLTHTIDNSEELLNDLWQTRDVRAMFNNSNFNYIDAVYLYLNLWPQCKGPHTNWNTNGAYIDENPLQFNGEGTAVSQGKHNVGLIESFMKSLTGFEYKDQWNDAIGHLWIKGNEILDPTGALVVHTFQGTVTWQLELDVMEKIHKPLRDPWKWINVYRRIQRVVIPGVNQAGDTYAYRTKYTKGNPYRSQSDELRYGTKIVCKNWAQTSAAPSLNADAIAPSQIATPGGTFTSTLPSYTESEMVRWGPSLSNLPTTTLLISGGTGGAPAMNTRAKRRRRETAPSSEK